MKIKYRNLKINDRNREKELVNSFQKFLRSGYYLRSSKSTLVEKNIKTHRA